jgi:hypothetical protein
VTGRRFISSQNANIELCPQQYQKYNHSCLLFVSARCEQHIKHCGCSEYLSSMNVPRKTCLWCAGTYKLEKVESMLDTCISRRWSIEPLKAINDAFTNDIAPHVSVLPFSRTPILQLLRFLRLLSLADN